MTRILLSIPVMLVAIAVAVGPLVWCVRRRSHDEVLGASLVTAVAEADTRRHPSPPRQVNWELRRTFEGHDEWVGAIRIPMPVLTGSRRAT